MKASGKLAARVGTQKQATRGSTERPNNVHHVARTAQMTPPPNAGVQTRHSAHQQMSLDTLIYNTLMGEVMEFTQKGSP